MSLLTFVAPFRIAGWAFIAAIVLILLTARHVNAAPLQFGWYVLFYIGYTRISWTRDFAGTAIIFTGCVCMRPVQQIYVMYFRQWLTPDSLFALAFVTTFKPAFCELASGRETFTPSKAPAY